MEVFCNFVVLQFCSFAVLLVEFFYIPQSRVEVRITVPPFIQFARRLYCVKTAAVEVASWCNLIAHIFFWVFHFFSSVLHRCKVSLKFQSIEGISKLHSYVQYMAARMAGSWGAKARRFVVNHGPSVEPYLL